MERRGIANLALRLTDVPVIKVAFLIGKPGCLIDSFPVLFRDRMEKSAMKKQIAHQSFNFNSFKSGSFTSIIIPKKGEKKLMKVILINGSPHTNGTTAYALKEVAKSLGNEGIETKTISIGRKTIRDCIGCMKCRETGKCIFDDRVNDIAKEMETADGIVFGTPVYYAHPSGAVLSLRDRLFYSAGSLFAHKVGAVLAVARRAGTTASLDVKRKHRTISNRVVCSSSYWNRVFGKDEKDAPYDAEGIQTRHNLGKNRAWLIKSIEAGKQAGVELPKLEKGSHTNFIR